MIYKVEAEGDKVYIKADSEAAAIARLTEIMGPIPRNILKISTVAKLPKGEDFL